MSYSVRILIRTRLFSELVLAFSEKADYQNVPGLKIDTWSMGVVNEGMNEILARFGARSLLLSEDYQIPASGQGGPLAFVDSAGNSLRFAEQEYAKFNLVKMMGVEGYFYLGTDGYDALHPYFVFSRNYAGTTADVPAGTEIETETADVVPSYVSVVCFQSTLGLTDEAFVQALSLLTARCTALHDELVVVVVTEAQSSLDQMLEDAYGFRYIRCDQSLEQMMADDFSLLAERIYGCLDQQGTFEAVRQAVSLALAQLNEL